MIAVPLGVLWGWSIGVLRMSRGGGRLLGQLAFVACVSMLAMPLYLHAAGWEGTAGKFGWVPLIQGGTRFWFRGLLASSWIHGTYGASWVSLATYLAMGQLPRSLHEAASLHLNNWRRDWLVALPIAGSWIFAAVVWSAIVAATEMTVADLYGVRTLADEVYKVYALQPQGVPVLTSVLLPLLLAVPLWMLSRRGLARWDWSRRGSGEASETTRPSSRGLHGVAICVALLGSLLVAVVPISALVVKAGWTVVMPAAVNQAAVGQVPTGGQVGVAGFSWSVAAETLLTAPGMFQQEFRWSLQLALFTWLLTLPLAWLMAAAASSHRWLRQINFAGCLLLAMIPGPIVSLVVIWLFNRDSLGDVYDRTLIPSIVALLPRALPAAYLILRGGYRLLDPAVNECAMLDGSGIWMRMIRIEAPRMRRALLLASLAVILVAFADLSATLLVLPPSVTTVASRLFGLLHSGVRNHEAGLALFAAFCVGIITAGIARLLR